LPVPPQAYKLLREAAGVVGTLRSQLLPALPGCRAADCHERLLEALEAAALADAQVGRQAQAGAAPAATCTQPSACCPAQLRC
jgi:hypothetical protein